MLIKGSISPRTSSRVDVPQQAGARPCRPQPSEEFLTFEDDVVFEWSRSIPPDVDERKGTRSRVGERSRSTDSHRPGLFSEVIGESLSQRSLSGSRFTSPTMSLMTSPTSLMMTPTLPDRSESSSAYSTRTTSRIDSAQPALHPRSLPSYRCQTAPPTTDVRGEIELDASNMVDVVMEQEMRSRERSKSCRLYGDHSRRLQENMLPKSARKVRRPNEERYLQHKYKERPCSRAESFVNEELFESTSDLSRECCDVLGPRHCYDCSKITQRNDSVFRNKSEFPSIHTTPKNISTITLVQRLFPELSTLDILEGVADGYISSHSFSKDRLMQMVERKKIEARKKEIKAKWQNAAKRRISAFSVPDKLYFFTNFTDLRAQLLAQRGSYTGFKGQLFPMTGAQSLPPPSEIELVIRKEEDRENPANYFCPPLMTREEIQRQKNQPRFYAGSEQEYKLPDAPPLTEILHKTNKALRDMDSQSVVPKTKKTPTEASPPLANGLQSGVRPRKSPLEINSSGGKGGMYKQVSARPSRPSKLGRPELGSSFARKSMAKSSLSRPLQMETLTEDGSQSEQDDVMKEEGNEVVFEEEEVEEEDNHDEGDVDELDSVGKMTTAHRARRAQISPILQEEDDESEGNMDITEMMAEEVIEDVEEDDN